jgi:hypothetical protein
MLTFEADTGAWPIRMDTSMAARYLREEHGLPTEPKTLVNHRALRKGPAVRYFGAKPLYDREELDRWARDEALQPTSPLTRNTRRSATAESTEQAVAVEAVDPVTKSGERRASDSGPAATPSHRPPTFPSDKYDDQRLRPINSSGIMRESVRARRISSPTVRFR